jgi:hypothetical protein
MKSDLELLLTKKVDSCVGWVQSQEAKINQINEAIEQLEQYKEKIENKISKFDSYVNQCMIKLDTDKLSGELSSIKKRKPTKIVKIINENDIPIEFIKVPEPRPTIAKSEIAKALKAGQEVAGCELVDSDTLSISYKIGG